MAMDRDASHNSYYELLSENERRLLKTDWPIVALFGQSGTGKSTFINLIAQEQQQVGEDIDSCTDKITFVEARIKGKPVVVVDTPSIDDTRPGVTEADAFAATARCLGQMGREKRWITGVLYLYRITDLRFTETHLRAATMISKLCGQQAMNRVMFCTTMWDMQASAESTRRHGQLCDAAILKGMISSGARTATHSNRWDNAQTSAENILSDLIQDLTPGPLAIQNEMLEEGKTAGQTSTGRVLTAHLQEERAKAEREITAIRQQMSGADKAKLAGLETELAALQTKVEELKRQEAELFRPDGVNNCCCIC